MSLSTTCQLTAVLAVFSAQFLVSPSPVAIWHSLVWKGRSRVQWAAPFQPQGLQSKLSFASWCLLHPAHLNDSHSTACARDSRNHAQGLSTLKFVFPVIFSHHRVHDIRGVFLILSIIIPYIFSFFHCVSIAPLTLSSLPRTKGKFKHHATAPGFPKILGGREGKVCFSPPMTESPLQAALHTSR